MSDNLDDSEINIPPGEEIIKKLFQSIESILGVGSAIASALKKIHGDNNLPKQSILNAIKALRDDRGYTFDVYVRKIFYKKSKNGLKTMPVMSTIN